MEWLQFALGTVFLLTGLVIFGIQIFGVFRFRYVLNRVHAAALGDTLGLGVSLIGIMIFSGWNFVTLKLFLIILFLWCSSPVSSHLVSRLEAGTNEHLEEHLEVEER